MALPRLRMHVETIKSCGFLSDYMGDSSHVLVKRIQSPEAKRHKVEYDTKYESSPKRVKYREELNQERRKRGMYGDRSHRDISHTQNNKLTVEDEHENRARHFKDKGTLRPVQKQEVPFADANHPVSMTEVSNLMLEDAPQQCTIQDCPNPEAQPVVRARYRNPIGSQDYTHHMCEDCAHKHELGYMVQKGEPIEIAFDVLKRDYPFVAVGEDERQLPVPMHTNRPRSTHPGFSRTDIFQVPTGVGIPTAQAAPRTVPVMHAQGRTYEIADKEQYERALRAPDEETRRAAMNEVPRVMTQGVQSRQNVFRMPTFYGMPYNEDTHFTTGEPMDLAFRLLKTEGLLSTSVLAR